jgi:hypothetical protein
MYSSSLSLILKYTYFILNVLFLANNWQPKILNSVCKVFEYFHLATYEVFLSIIINVRYTNITGVTEETMLMGFIFLSLEELMTEVSCKAFR